MHGNIPNVENQTILTESRRISCRFQQAQKRAVENFLPKYLTLKNSDWKHCVLILKNKMKIVLHGMFGKRKWLKGLIAYRGRFLILWRS
jgi:hypothetical protein